jgi:N-acetylmuramoyl-L-alanine amidase
VWSSEKKDVVGDTKMKTLKFFLLCAEAIFLCGYSYSSVGAQPQQQTTVLAKVFRHEGVLQDKIVCYFDNEPLCTVESHPALQGFKRLTLHVPHVHISDEAKKMIGSMGAKNTTPYKVTFEPITKPNPALLIRIAYQDDVIGFEYATFNSISAQKGLSLHFYHKNELARLKQKTDSILKYARTNQPHIVVDCGHGGDDTGKVGCFGIKEKEITLSIGRQLAQTLTTKGYRVSLTRSTDTFVPLDKRTTYANSLGADLFVSIHANSGVSEHAHGLETYWSGDHLIQTHMECTDNVLKKKYMDYIAARDRASFDLAHTIHNELLTTVRQKFTLHDRKVKSSVGQVIFGTQMPSVIVELGFISNLKEARLLKSKEYQQVLVQGIQNGIQKYQKIHRRFFDVLQKDYT